MIDPWQLVLDWPPILQGALGSALFWVVQLAVTSAARRIPSLAARLQARLQVEGPFQEYIYRKYTSRNGLIYYSQGFFVSARHSLRHIVEGLIFVSIALLVAGTSAVTYSISIVGALAYFARALSWLRAPASWSGSDLQSHWLRVAQLELALFGTVQDDTTEFLKAHSEVTPGSADKVENGQV